MDDGAWLPQAAHGCARRAEWQRPETMNGFKPAEGYGGADRANGSATAPVTETQPRWPLYQWWRHTTVPNRISGGSYMVAPGNVGRQNHKVKRRHIIEMARSEENTSELQSLMRI